MAARVDPADPENSLLLKKPTLSVIHGGGLRFPVGNAEYRSLLAWIKVGAPGPSADDARFVSLHVAPVHFARTGEMITVKATASYSDGSQADVTDLCRFSTTDDLVATADGPVVTGKGRGDAFLVVRYAGKVAASAIVSDITLAKAPAVRSKFSPKNFIDEYLQKRWKRLGIAPSETCSDSEFLRRASLDLTGMLPTADATLAFLQEPGAGKRAKLLDRLLASEEFADRWSQWWGDMLRVNRLFMQRRGVEAIHKYLRDSVSSNKPLSVIAREILTANGQNFEDGPVNFYMPLEGLEQGATSTSRVFLGIRLDCAQCHNHPYENWSQEDFYRFASMFGKTRTVQGAEKDEKVVKDVPDLSPLHIAKRSDNPLMQPGLLDGKSVNLNADLRAQLADWIVGDKGAGSGYFDRNFANRIWAQLMGRGIFDPVDDYRFSNPPVDADLLDALAQSLIKSGYDFKAFIKTVVSSAAYQLTTKTNGANKNDLRTFSHAPPRRLGAEEMADAVCQITGIPEQYGDAPIGTRAMQLPDTAAYSRFLDIFGRPKRQQVVCTRENEPTLTEALFLMNNGAIQNKIASDSGNLAKRILTGESPTGVIEWVYLSSLCRKPTKEEMSRILPLVESAKDRKQALEDVMWAVFNSREFQFRR